MKTWTNPEIEELEVKLTANGTVDLFREECIPGAPDMDFANDDLTTGKDSDGDGWPIQPETPETEEGTPS